MIPIEMIEFVCAISTKMIDVENKRVEIERKSATKLASFRRDIETRNSVAKMET